METTVQNLKSALVVHQNDNVAVALSDFKKGDQCTVRLGKTEQMVTVQDDINFGHKLALNSIGKDESVLKYGEEIGRITIPVSIGDWVHSHNMYCERGMK